MATSFDLSGRATLTLAEGGEDVLGYLRAQMDPYAPADTAGPSSAPEVKLAQRRDSPDAFADIQNSAGDGLVTASDGRALSLVVGGRSCTLPAPGDEASAHFTFDRGFPLWRIFGTAVRPALQIAMLSRSAVAVHSASVELNGGLMVAGWSESGKTETALALMEDGARFLSDKWTVLGEDGGLSAFPIGVGIRRWVLRYLPRLRASLPAAARAQFAAVAGAAYILEPARRLRAGGRRRELAVELADRAVKLGDRAGLPPSELRRVYGQQDDPRRIVPLRTLALLRNATDAGVSCEPADPAWAAARLARSAAVERRGYFALQERAAFAFPEGRPSEMHAVVEREERLLAATLLDVQVLDVRAPFPTDPRRVATAIHDRL